MSEYVELYIDQGSDFTTYITLNDDNTNLPEPLVSTDVTAQMRKSMLSVNAAATFVCAVTDAANGEMQISLDAANTSNLKFGSYFFDVRTYDRVSHNYSRLIEGIIHVTPGITR